ncbi:carboxymuconolactone decarboxylase family protein [Actinomadura craniellae]|nr:carboxymuconolactone decarboxylase family protein [Actinomadura craniellae]
MSPREEPAPGRPPRLPLTTEADWDDETRRRIEVLNRQNIFTALANHPDLLRRWLVFGGHVLRKSTLPARERELVILRVGWRCGSAYEFGQHRIIGREAGLTDTEIDRLAGDIAAAEWTEADRTLLRAADQLVDTRRVDDATWAELAAGWSTQQVMDLVFTVGQYVLTCMALNTFEIPLDEGLEGFPS